MSWIRKHEECFSFVRLLVHCLPEELQKSNLHCITAIYIQKHFQSSAKFHIRGRNNMKRKIPVNRQQNLKTIWLNVKMILVLFLLDIKLLDDRRKTRNFHRFGANFHRFRIAQSCSVSLSFKGTETWPKRWHRFGVRQSILNWETKDEALKAVEPLTF